MRPDIVPGGSFPDYELRDHTGTKRKLSELQGTAVYATCGARGSSNWLGEMPCTGCTSRGQRRAESRCRGVLWRLLPG